MTNSQHWFRGVRTSKFRHVYGAPARREGCYENVAITRNAHDAHFCAANPKFVAVVTEVAGGGTFIVIPIHRTGRLDLNASRVTGHRGPVLDIKWSPFNDNIIASCSDDATVKLWYIPDGGLSTHLSDWLIDLRGHKRRVGHLEWHPTAENILVSAGFDHLLIVWDVGRGEALSVIDCHPDVIYSMSFNRDGSLLATTCKDKKLRVLEPRKGVVLQENVCHAGTKACKTVFLGSTGRILTTGFSRHSDRQYAIWSQSDLSQPLAVESIDSSSGVLFPYYDHDTRIVFLAGKGDGNIRYYESTDQAPWLHYLNQYLSGAPQRGLGFMPKRGCDAIQCEIFRFYKLHASKGLVEPISMIVPRKSDLFQHDLYPDTAAPTPALSAQDWFSGKNRNPVLMSMQTGITIDTLTKSKVQQNNAEITANAANETGHTNNSKKFAFLSQETIPDYRPKPSEIVNTEMEKKQKTSNNQTQQTQQRLDSKRIITNNEEKSNISGKTEWELQRTFTRQQDEIQTLKRQLANRERRIRELEEVVRKLQQTQIKNL